MEVEFREAPGNGPIERIYIAAVILKNLRGSQNVEVQLFRPIYDHAEIEELKNKGLVSDTEPGMPAELMAGATEESALACLLESFTLEEARAIAKYLEDRYADQAVSLTICPMKLPVPLGLGPLQSVPETEKSGFIHFDKAPDYPLDFQFKGYYDLG